MHYSLTGFTHDVGFRVFAFEGVGEDRVRTEFKVRADLALSRKHGIQVQDLPLLCRGILERRDEASQERAFIYTEAEMCVHEDAAVARVAAAKKKKAPRRPPSENTGAAWRAASPTQQN